MSGHTPGPWHTGQSPSQAAHGQRSIGFGLEPDGSIFGYRLGVDNDDGKYMNLSGYCSEEDARLIAAAPDLLAALVALEAEAAEFDKAIPPYGNSEPLKAARAAIALATGAEEASR